MDRPLAACGIAGLTLALALTTTGCASDNTNLQAQMAASAAWDAASGSPAVASAASATGTAGGAAASTSTAGATAAGAKTAAATAATPGGKTAAAATVIKLGDPGLVGDWTLTVIGADKQPLDPKGNPAPSGSAVLQIDATAANNSKAPMKSPIGDYQLVDSAGTAMKLAPSDPGMGYNEGTGADAVAAGSEAAFSIAYLVPSSAKGLTFVFTPSAGAKATAKVTIP